MQQQMPDMNKVEASTSLPSRAPDGEFDVKVLKVYAHTGGQTNDLLAVIEYEITGILSQQPTTRIFFEKGQRGEKPVATVVVGDRRTHTFNFKYKSGPGEWRAQLEFFASHPAVKEDVKDWKKFNEDIMAAENPLEGIAARLRVTSKITGGGNTFALHSWSYPTT